MNYDKPADHTIEVSTAEVLEIWKLLKEREAELNQNQYLLFKKTEKIVYAVFSVSELEAFGKSSTHYEGKR